MFETIRFNLVNLANFRGRQTRAKFWPYVAFVIILSTIGMALVMLPSMLDDMSRMQRFATEHPELATIHSGPGNYSISIQGNHPELMPDIGGMVTGMAIVIIIVIALLAAAVTRRLHDRSQSGYWGILPVPFIAFACFVMPKVFAQNPPDMTWFLALFFNNLIYMAALVTLIVKLAGAGTAGTNRYDAPAGG